ncbi:MAG: M20/M25/M40 family metallo-hydrolase, partial [Deltaproteobacteria bacterium]|nr:M20/M25/M40 family metallo-hydrolase [Deltaproteobacteria bacterium]
MSVDWPQVREEAIRILSAYIQIDTTNPPGRELAGARFLQGLLEREGLPAVVLETRPERGNVFSFLEGTEGLSPLILLHHIDVVPAETEKWRFPPLSGTVDQGEVWGRGAQDCKSLGVMELLALLLLKREGFRPRRRIVYLGTAVAVAGGPWGVAWLFQNRP